MDLDGMNNRPALRILNQMAGPMTWELAIDLAAALERVDILTGHPDTLAKGSQRGVHLHPAKAYQRGSNLRRFASWARYSLHAGYWLLRGGRSFPVLVFSNPPITIWICWLFNRIFGLRYAVMVHDIYPDTIERMGIVKPTNLLARVWRFANRIAYERAEVVMTLGNHMANHVGRQFDAAKTSAGELLVVDPWADPEKLGTHTNSENWFAVEHDQTEKLTVMYSGNMGRGHDIESILEASKSFRDEPNVGFMFIGAGPKWQTVEKYLCDDQHASNVTLLPWQREEDLPFTLTTADIGVVSLEKELSGLAVPSKAFYFLAAGVPVLGICESDTELADTIREFNCGRVVPPGRPHEIAATVQDALTNPALMEQWKAGANEARQHFSRARNTERFLKVLREYLLPPSRKATEPAHPTVVANS